MSGFSGVISLNLFDLICFNDLTTYLRLFAFLVECAKDFRA